MAAYYNENDPKTAAWLRELIKAKLIADGEVDTRSIVDVQSADLARFAQCHFFAGIGGWSYALRLAGWADDRAVWTGSCPCQPWSDANVWEGGGQGDADPRHLWPAWFQLIEVARPPVVFGEQVAAAAPSLAVARDPLVRARRAVAGDYSDLLPCDGVSVVMERHALKGYGNAIVPEVAAEVIAAYME